MTNVSNAEQAELFSAETTWFHIFRTMIVNDEMAKMGALAYATYCAIKAYTNFATGQSFPSLELLSAKTGISLTQIKRELKVLESMGYLTKTKNGRSNLYQLREKIEIQDASGRPQAYATWDYLPNGVGAAVADLKNVMISGDLSGAKIIHIEKLTVNVNSGPGTQINLDIAKMADTPLRRQLEALIAKANKEQSDS